MEEKCSLVEREKKNQKPLAVHLDQAHVGSILAIKEELNTASAIPTFEVQFLRLPRVERAGSDPTALQLINFKKFGSKSAGTVDQETGASRVV